MRSSRCLVAAAAAFIFAAPALAADTFDFTISAATSTASYDVSSNAPFTGTLTGDTAATPPSRVKRFANPFSCGTLTPTTNDTINISGTLAASGMNSNLRPTGAYRLTIDPVAGTASVSSLSLNILGASTASVAASLNSLTYQSFCTVNPSCTLPFLFPITLPAGNVTITTLTAVQGAGAASGTLVAGGPNTWTFAIPVNVTVTAVASFGGAPLPTAPQVVPIALAGTITVSGSTATVTSSLDVDFSPPSNTEPIALPPTPFPLPPDSPLCPGLNLLVALTVQSTTIDVSTSMSLPATGVRVNTCPCDWNQAGGLTVQDIFDFLGSYFAGGNAGDFNDDGATTVQDIFDFLSCYFQGC